MPNIHELLDETKTKADELVRELTSLRNARVLSENLNQTLNTTCGLLQQTVKAIRPLTDQRVKRIQIILITTSILNTLLFLAILLLWIFRK